MPSLFAIKRSKALPFVFLLLHFCIATIAAPFTPVIGNPIPIFYGGLNIYPCPKLQEDIEYYSFNEEDMYFDKDIRYPFGGVREQQHELMNKVNGEFFREFLRTPDDYEFYSQWDESHKKDLTGGDVFHKSGSSDVEGRGNLRITPTGKRRHPLGHAKTSPQNSAEDNHSPHPSKGHLTKRDTDLDGLLKPQTVCDFLHLPPTCSDELTLPLEILDMPIVSIEVEHSEQSLRIVEDLGAPDPTPDYKDPENQPGSGPSLTGPGRLRQDLDAFVPVFLKIGFLPSAAKALDVDSTAVGFLDMPVSGIPVGIPYTDTLTGFHEVQTICLSREIGPFVVCERVYGKGDIEEDDIEEPVELIVDLENPTTTTLETTFLEHTI